MITYHRDIVQKSQEWRDIRCGMLTASAFDTIITSKGLKFSESAGCRSLMYDLLAQRITKYVEEGYIGYDMMRGEAEEVYARELYTQYHAPVEECGFITNYDFGFTLGYSPDGLVGDDGLIEVKSRAPKYQMQTIVEDKVPEEYLVQIQVGLMITQRKWCDFISYCGGLPMFVKRVEPDQVIHAQLHAAASEFEGRLSALEIEFGKKALNMIPTERKDHGFRGEIV